jgi:Uma2 family endonuclease
MPTVTPPSQGIAIPYSESAIALLDDDVLYEVVDNEIREIPYLGAFETNLASTLLRILGHFVFTAKLGRADSEMLFLISPERNLQRRPDVSFVSYKRWSRNRPVPSVSAWEVVPDLAVEFVSPSNTANELARKVDDYFEAGVECVWVVYPVLEKIHVMDSPTSVRILARNDTLDGGTVVPGFQLRLSEFFPSEHESSDDAGA